MSTSTPQPGRAIPPVVTIFESYGSGADEVGPRVAEALGVAVHAQAFSSDELEGSAEQRDEGLLARVLTAMGGSYAALEGPAVAMAQRDDHELVLRNTRWVMDAARPAR